MKLDDLIQKLPVAEQEKLLSQVVAYKNGGEAAIREEEL